MRTIVVYGGRFQPPHPGHLATYRDLCHKYGDDNVYVASADKHGPSDPFSWQEKRQLAKFLGIPDDKFIKVRNVYSERSIRDVLNYDPTNTIMLLAFSAKDGNKIVGSRTDNEGYALNKNGKRSVIQWANKNLTPITHGFVYALKTKVHPFRINNRYFVNATDIRNMYANANQNSRLGIVDELYGNRIVKPLLDKRLNPSIIESYIQTYKSWCDLY